MKITIITTGRFHVASLARELGDLGHDVALYSYVPNFKAKPFNLDRINHKSYFWILMPFILGERIKIFGISKLCNKLLVLFYDFILSKTVPKCDVLIFMSGIFIKTPKRLKEKYSCKLVIERGSTHILTQQKILSKILDYDPISPFFINRELLGYEIADLISVPADHTKHSFLEHGVDKNKIIQNPYGVNLEAFSPLPFNTSIPPTIIMVGNWCLRKGADLILDTLKLLPEFCFLHVGAITDIEFPFDNPQFEHVDPVPENSLPEFYARGHVFILPSREEGLALVQLQALACGLPVIHTYRTGASDLKKYVTNKDMIVTVKGNPTDIKNGIKNAYKYRQSNQQKNLLTDLQKSQITWAAYGKRYEQHLTKQLNLK